jgi:GTPase
MISIAARAAEQRTAHHLKPFTYSIVLTKADKIPPSELREMHREVSEAIRRGAQSADIVCSIREDEAGDSVAASDGSILSNTNVIVTSAVTRQGAEQVWELIYNLVLER